MALDLDKIDLGGFGITETQPEENVQVRANMDEAVKINPDQHANITKLSKETGVPEFAVESNPEKVEEGLKLDNIDFSQMSKRNPNTEKYLTDFNNSIIAQDDIDILQSIENILGIGDVEGPKNNIDETDSPVPTFKEYNPTIFDRISNFFTNTEKSRARASNERVARRIAEREGITVSEVYESVGGDRPDSEISGPGRLQTFVGQSVQGLGSVISGAIKSTSIARQATAREEIAGINAMLAGEEPKRVTNALLAIGENIKMMREAEESGDLETAAALREGINDRRELILSLIVTDPKQEELFKIGDKFDESIKGFIETNPEFEKDLFTSQVPHGLGQMVSFATTAAISRGSFLKVGIPNVIASLGPTAATGAMIQYSSAFEDALAHEANFETALKAAEQNIALGYTEAIPIVRLFDRLDKGSGGLIKRGVANALKTGFEEGVQESFQQIMSNAIAQDLYDPTRGIWAGVGEGAKVGFTTGAIIGFLGTMISGRRGGTSSVVDDTIEGLNETESKKETKGEAEQIKIDQINEKSEKSKLKQRDKESFKQFVEQADGDNNTTVFVDAAQTSLYLQSKTRDEIENDPALKLLDEQVREAAELGTDIQIPVADFSAEITGTEHYTQLRDSMTMSDETTSPFRQEQVQKETEVYIQTLMDEAQDNTSQYVEAQNIYESVRGQLIDTGTVTPANASIMAQVVPAWATAQATRQGKTIQQVYEDSGLVVEGPQTGEKARLQGEQVLEQQSVTVADLKTQIESEGVSVQLTGSGDVVTLNKIVVPEEQRETGIGTTAMNRVIDWADANGKIIALSPSEDFGGDIKRLKQFYKGLGFVENKGKNKDFEISETMFYTPKEILKQTPIETMNADQVLKLSTDVPRLSKKANDALTESIKKDGVTKPVILLKSTDGITTLEDGHHRVRIAKELGIDVPVTTIEQREGETDIQVAARVLDAVEGVVPIVLEQKPTKTKEARGYYDPANSIIRLTESADLSTFLHEFAHFMYEMEIKNDSDMVQNINSWYKRNADDVIKEASEYAPNTTIIEKHVIQFLDEGTTGGKERDDAIRRAVHEQFARGFETYLMEGKAPSIELRNAFRAFARWLSRIYQTLRGQLNVNVDEEMNQVFDRLIATEEQIQAAQARARVEPMFTNAAMAGMTEEEFINYQKIQEKVKDVQSETLRDKIINQLTRQTKKWWKEQKQDIIDENIDELNKEQVYIARNRLKDGDIKLDHATVKEMIGEEKTNKLGRKSIIIPTELRGMTAKGQQGVHPDEAAAFFGYGSGSEMLSDLVTAPSIKDQAEVNAEKIMIERHGDILTDGTIEREADEAVQNEERGKLILQELKVLAKGTNAPVVERNAIKDLAEERIGKLSFREVHPGKYRKAEIQAAQESTRMLSEGNKEGAAVAKMRQVMNYYLGMSATKSKNETMKIVDNMNRYNKKKVREEIQKSEGGYWDQIVTILNRFEFRKTATLKQVESLNLWAKQRMEEVGDGLVLSNTVLNESYVTHWKNVPFSDLQGINDSVKNIEHVARYSNRMTKMQEEIDFNKLKSNWVDNINKQDSRFKNKTSRSRIDDARKSTKAEHIQRWISQLTKIPFMASWLDGGDRVGLSHDILVQPFTDALDSKIKLLDDVAAPVIKAIASRSKEDTKHHNRKIFIPEIDDNLSGDQIIAVALNTGNQGNLKKLLLGEKWADPENEADISFNNPKLQAILKHMNRNDWELVQLIWDQMEKLYPQLAEVHRKTTGLVPPKVESTPFTALVGGITGENINMRGGYYPIKYSPKRSHKAEKNAEKRDAETESMFNNTASIQASVNTGATNERTGFYDKIFLSLDVVPDHFNETIHYITHHDAVRQVNRLIQSPEVADAITGVLGEAEYKELKPWLNDIAKDGRQQPVKTFIDEAFQQLRFGTTLGVMGFKASTGIMQVFGLFTTAAELGIGPTIKGIRTVVGNSFYSKAILKTLGSRNNLQSGWDFAAERSKVLPHRAKTMDREIKNAMNRLSGKTGTLAAVQEVSMKHIALIQTYIVDLPTWHAAYDKHLSENGDESKAVRFADTTVENIQGSGNVMNMARIMRNQSKIHSTFTMFMTFFSSLGNLTRDLVRGVKSGQYSITSAAAKAMFLFTLPVFFEMLMRGELDDKDDGEDERMNKFLINSALYPLTSLPFVRDIASGALSDFGYNSTPVAAMMERGITSGKGLVENIMTDEEVTKSQIKNVSKLAGAALGVPGLNQMWSSGEHLFDVIEEGEEFTTRELLFGPDRK